MTKQSWKVGELARATGLTVRTLHHYDDIGLLVPSGHTDSGYRLYGDEDVRRLYAILALRDLQLSLEQIGATLDAGIDLATLMRQQLKHVEHQIAAAVQLRQRITHALDELTAGETTIDDYLQILEAMVMFEKYYTPDQLAALEERRNVLGAEGMERAQREWGELITAVRAEHAVGTDPSHPRMQELAAQWRSLMEQFTGGDAGIQQSLTKMYETEGSENASRGAVDPELMAYVGKALVAGK
ncbi:MAG: MerR family transcriptional regulator [Chloroflexota bacterium]